MLFKGMYTMTQYKADYPFQVVFGAQKMDNVLAEWLSQKKIPQIHIAGPFVFFSILQNL